MGDVIPLFRLRATSQAEDDLDWYVNEADSALGVRSNFGRMLEAAAQQRLKSGGKNAAVGLDDEDGAGPASGVSGRASWAMKSDPEDAAIQRASSVRRHREIRNRLRRCRVPMQALIETAFQRRVWSPAMLNRFGMRIANIATCSPTARAWFKEDTQRRKITFDSIRVWLESLVARAAEGDTVAIEWLNEIRLECELMYGEAMSEFDPKGSIDVGKVGLVKGTR
jgi:hypothetical protein